MRHSTLRIAALLGSVAFLVLSTRAGAQSSATAQPPTLPKEATTLTGSPTVRVDTTPEGTSRRQLTAAEAKEHGLKISIVNGRYFWTNRQNEPLTVRQSGEFTYLSSKDPGQYVRFRRINDRLAYVEHLDMGLGSVTYWGELQISLDK